MQFQVPQFIEVEDKIFGPLTFKQFIYLAGGVGLSFVLYQSFPLFLAILFIIPVAALSLALAFYKVNEKPFIDSLEAAVKYFLRGKLYLWKKRPPKAAGNALPANSTPVKEPKLSESKLKDLAWSLDVNEKISR